MVPIQIGDVIRMKKQHPCGSFDWEVVRIGVDFKIKCKGCDHLVMLPREKVLKGLKMINGTKYIK